MIDEGTNDVNSPREVYKNFDTEWRVLRRYDHSQGLCAIKSPFTGISYHLEVVSFKDIVTDGGVKVQTPILKHW